MAAKKNTVTVPTDAPVTLSMGDLFDTLTKRGIKEVEGIAGEREALTLENVGDYFVGRLVAVKKSAKAGERGVHFVIYYFNLPDGRQCYYLGSFDFDGKMTDGEFGPREGVKIGNVYAVGLIDLVDVSKPQLMKLYAVLDVGADFPPEVLTDKRLPF